MMIGIALLVVIILLATRALAVRAKKTGRQASVASIVTINGIIVAIVASLFGVGWYGFQLYRHDTCVARADGRNGYRNGQIALFDAFDVFTGTTKYTTSAFVGLDGKPHPSLRDGLNMSSPALDPTDCPSP